MEFKECTECKYFISCESGKQYFHKITETPCNEFKEKPQKVYIAGKITGNAGYKQQFDAVMEKYKSAGHIVLNPANLPDGMTPADYMEICFSMINVAEKVVFLSGYEDSRGAMLEKAYCEYIGKRFCFDPQGAKGVVGNG